MKRLLFLLCLVLVSCGQKDKYREDYGIVGTNMNLAISDKHMGGYGRSQCLLCHNLSLNIHRGPNATSLGATPSEIAAMVTANGVENTCLFKCHRGANGVNGL